MALASFKIEFSRRQAMLSLYEDNEPVYPWQDISDVIAYMKNRKVIARVPVFVWPIPHAGYFIVEHQDGSCTYAHPSDLTFLGSKELFDQYSWEEA